MAEQMLATYKSRRNRARLIQTDTGRFVVKTFSDNGSFQKEAHIYRLLQGKDVPCAKVVSAQGNTLVLSELPGQNLVDCLEQQEQLGLPIWDVWDKLVAWLSAFQQMTGLVMTDVNLRNFLYDEATNTLYGLDFEECEVCSMLIPAARVAAYIRTYKPEHTQLKQEISQHILNLFARTCGLDAELLFRESGRQETKLLDRRNHT